MERFRKSQLKSGMVVRTADGRNWVVILNSIQGDILITKDTWNRLECYNEYLESTHQYISSIVEVGVENEIGWGWDLDSRCWKRATELPVPMTKAQIEKELGYRVELVDEAD